VSQIDTMLLLYKNNDRDYQGYSCLIRDSSETKEKFPKKNLQKNNIIFFSKLLAQDYRILARERCLMECAQVPNRKKDRVYYLKAISLY